MASPQNFISRKRKCRSSSSISSDPFIGRFTRSKTQWHLHCSRSGRAWPGRNPFQKQPHLMVTSPFRKPNRKTLEATPNLSSVRKIRRARASRTLSSDGGVVGDRESAGFVTELEFGGKGCSSVVVEGDVHLDLGFKSSASGLSEADKEPFKNNKDSDLNKKEISIKTEKGCCLDKRNAQNSGNKLGKVFKSPASFSYRRLLPYLTEMAKSDSGTPCDGQNIVILDSSLPSFIPKCAAAQHLHARQNSVGDKSEERNSQYSGAQHPIEGCDLEDPSNSSARIEGHGEMLTADLANNSSNEMDEFSGDFVQTTPPDAAILGEFGINDRSELEERKPPFIEIQLFGLKPPNISCKEYVCDSGNSYQSPSQKSDSSPKTKPFLNRCSRLKIFKPSSFSYRRLLPYLMDVAKSTPCASNTDQPSELKNNFRGFSKSKSLSGEDIERTDFHDKFLTEKQVSNACPIAPLINASSAEIYPESSLDNSVISAAERTVATSEAASATATPNAQLCVELERTVQQEAAYAITDVQLPFHSETEFQHNDTVKNSELDRSVATSSSCTESELLCTEPIPKLENGYHLIEKATLNNNLLPVEGFDHCGIQNHNLTKGILKRNPRGCRGLCNCLNCSSFRLHAERSFEFSKNQLLDAEELAFGLIDELANLRSLLEKSAEDGCYVAAIKCDQLQAKEACRKALITEQVAKQRLSLLNDDLNVHCRKAPLLRPQVTFSEYNKERLVPMANYPTKPKRS